MNDLDLEKPKRQSPVGVSVIFFKNLRIAVNVFISVILVQFGLKFSFLGLGLEGLGIVIALIFLIISYLQYRRFFFYVVDDKFIIEKGLISRDKITIPFDRIQTVNLNQNLIQQLFSVVALKIDTAGSSEKELEIPALENTYARQLQKFLMEKKQEVRGEAEGSGEMPEKQEIKSEKNALIRLNSRDLLMVGLTENHLRTGLVLFAVINGYIWQFEEYLLKPFEGFLEEQANLFLAQWLILLPLIVLAFLVISVLLSMIQAVLKYFNLQFFVDAKGVQLISGLFKRSEFQIPVNKIQFLKWKSNPLRKIIGLKTLVIKQASSEDVGDRSSVKIPGCRKPQLDLVLDEFFPERKTSSFYFFKVHPLLFMQLALWLGLVPALAMSFSYFYLWWLSFSGVLYLPLALWFIYKYYRSVGLAVNKEVLILQKGWVYPNSQILKFYKLQDIRYSQSVFQRRRKLASLHFYTAAGAMNMQHIPEAEARQLYNYILFKIESSEKSWM